MGSLEDGGVGGGQWGLGGGTFLGRKRSSKISERNVRGGRNSEALAELQTEIRTQIDAH